MGDYSYFCDGRCYIAIFAKLRQIFNLSSEAKLIELLTRLEKHAGKELPEKWIQLVKEKNFEKLTRDLIVEYYDKNYKTPRGEALQTFQMPPRLILSPLDFLTSPVLEEIIQFGKEFVSREPAEVQDTDNDISDVKDASLQDSNHNAQVVEA